MAKFIAPNGKAYSSQKAYERSLKGMFGKGYQKKVRLVNRQRERQYRREQKAKKKLRPESFKEGEVVILKGSPNVISGNTTKGEEDIRIHQTTYQDKEGDQITVIEGEEGGRYTPKTSKLIVEEEGEEMILTRVGGRKERVISRTNVIILPSGDKELIKLDLEKRFRKGEKLSLAESRILAKSRGIKTGGITLDTLHKRIKKSLGGEK